MCLSGQGVEFCMYTHMVPMSVPIVWQDEFIRCMC